MKKHLIYLQVLISLLWGIQILSAQEKPVTITLLSVNDMHASLDRFPRFAFMVDSLRSIYPDLLLISAGDNQTGNPINDQFTPKGIPMIELMNAVGFDYSTVGNHEFDTRPHGFALLTQEAHFPFICANVQVEPHLGIRILPSTVHTFYPQGVRIALLGAVQLEADGKPATHPDWLNGIQFEEGRNVLPRYKEMSDKCDATILISHLGFEEDRVIAEQNPWIDLIIGGHSHTYLPTPIEVGSVSISQSGSKLQYLNMMQLTLKQGQVIRKEAHSLPIDPKAGAESKEVRTLVNQFNNNPQFSEVIGVALDHFTSYDQLGYFMVDAYRAVSGSDIAVQNNGGVRISNLLQGDITRRDIFTLDPFGNELMVVELSLDELKALLLAGTVREEDHKPLLLSGATAYYTFTPDKVCTKVELRDSKGKPLSPKRRYKVAYNSYINAAYPYEHEQAAVGLGYNTAEAIMQHVIQLKNVPSYQAVAPRNHIKLK
ncbi:MAG: bifunctional UDP-sugar hydrolase/5'-nucleotidase [Bacteroidales bacterium]|nr:bifunctional metallophosphatase/5'-nucleotidase [Porphyromonas sp.]MDD6934780.1 bifunctional UDP-sugar hydrolase/5'-nucleotidase [Bacteroidales bacterium]MDY3102698.1 bifunctional UDP-sugar hydrolase/5'-nucleotidase [Porphyromonas sp.]